ncbi:hypothetical protein [Lentzea cavernae]|uniref:RNA polymerase subunit sigma n=1 Tax=Lentzea cavernae TaxID=2020703 RepID=A0ABQ3M892_9PSEU|nr:hypothetical protein [Lentzea cavernae]GHH34926.1 hypothetical protein GCM10017774_19710 [Lentzea cavernae]
MDEMDLMKKLRDVPSPGPEAYDDARAALRTAMAEPVAAVVRPKRWFSWPKAGVAALGAAAVATAVVMGTTGGSVPPPAPPAAAPQAVESPLVKLASEVKAAAVTGDSSLIVRTNLAPDKSQYIWYTVYTDKGQTFHGDSPKTLAQAAAKGSDLSTDYDRRLMGAARLAATGDLEQARNAMVNGAGCCWALGGSPAEQEKSWAEGQEKRAEVFRMKGMEVPPAKPRPTGKELEDGINNTLWSNTTYALFIGAANPDIRAGSLKLLSTIKDVTIDRADFEGRPVMKLAAGPAVSKGEGSHVVTVDAETALPIRSEVVPLQGPQDPHSVANYKSSRVNLADIATGKI